MKFSRVFRGYNPQDVEKYIAEQKTKQDVLLAEKKQRIDELADENFTLRKNLEQYQSNEQAIVQCLLIAQKCAEKLKKEAENTVKNAAMRAQVFYDSWQSYAKTLVSALSDDEVVQFNRLKRQFQQLLEDFNSQLDGDIADNARTATVCETNPSNGGAQISAPHANFKGIQSGSVQFCKDNPLTKLRQAVQSQSEQNDGEHDVVASKSQRVTRASTDDDFSANAVIDLEELAQPTETLAELCRALGLKVQK